LKETSNCVKVQKEENCIIPAISNKKPRNQEKIGKEK
jgi:hypothetical protein